jgi:membrane-anchored mycosin MYCP
MPIDSREPTVKVRENQIVVDLDQLEKLEPLLPLGSKVIDRNAALRLALIDVGPRPRAETDADADAQVEELINRLREAYRAEYGDELVIGKNRIVGSVAGSPYTGGGSGVASPYTGGIRGKGQGGARLAEGNALPERRDAKRSVRVGILDTRLFEHSDLAGRYLASFGTLVTDDQRPTAAYGLPEDQVHANLAHATFIAGVILQRAPDADLDIRRGLDEDAAASSSWEVAVKMAEFADAGLAVLNISFGAITADDEPPLVLTRAIEALRSKAVTVVAAAGNNGPNSKKMWPAALPQVIAVGADREGSLEPAAFSPVNTEWVDVMAPGEQVYSTYELKSYAHWDGTSFATPAVSGAIAYLMQSEGMSPDDAVAWLKTPPAARKAFPGSAAMDDIRPI